MLVLFCLLFFSNSRYICVYIYTYYLYILYIHNHMDIPIRDFFFPISWVEPRVDPWTKIARPLAPRRNWHDSRQRPRRRKRSWRRKAWCALVWAFGQLADLGSGEARFDPDRYSDGVMGNPYLNGFIQWVARVISAPISGVIT